MSEENKAVEVKTLSHEESVAKLKTLAEDKGNGKLVLPSDTMDQLYGADRAEAMRSALDTVEDTSAALLEATGQLGVAQFKTQKDLQRVTSNLAISRRHSLQATVDRSVSKEVEGKTVTKHGVTNVKLNSLGKGRQPIKSARERIAALAEKELG